MFTHSCGYYSLICVSTYTNTHTYLDTHTYANTCMQKLYNICIRFHGDEFLYILKMYFRYISWREWSMQIKKELGHLWSDFSREMFKTTNKLVRKYQGVSKVHFFRYKFDYNVNS